MIHDYTGPYVLDALDAADRSAFDEHLRDCESCRDEVIELRTVAAHLALALPPVPAASIKDRVMADIRTHQRLQRTAVLARVDAPIRTASRPPRTEPDPPQRHRIAWATGGVGALAVAAALVGGLLLDKEPEPHTSIALEQVRREHDAVTRDGILVAGDGSASAVLSRSTGKVAVSATGLPTLETGRGYQLWVVRRNGLVYSAGMMRTSGRHAELVADLPKETRMVTITTEPNTGSVGPTTPLVARIDLI
ncbi:hypothetical protein D5S18_28880 [Nocardia panacis]|uniref:Regulator of SigK n=1 Tax=Nocardia panacis TaxID=2340916 RepID=A0A3A4K968_9NOCA|nr:anti-sigma factor [Nocardia panacis]RJO69904.1 hypothetical protein D5S18_28880 [Nocardia panacis]